MEEKVNNIFTKLKESVGVASPPLQKWSHPKKGKLRIMPISDSPWAPTGFGTNTKNVAAILRKDGHHIGYGGCQNPRHDRYEIPWPLNQTETTEEVEQQILKTKKQLITNKNKPT